MPSVLFLDDNPARRKRFLEHCPMGHIVATADEAILCLGASLWHRCHAYDLVFLDHDLGDEVDVDPSGENTGSEVARWIVANRPRIGRVICHTMGSYGVAMRDALRAAGYEAEYIGFMSLVERFDEVLNVPSR